MAEKKKILFLAVVAALLTVLFYAFVDAGFCVFHGQRIDDPLLNAQWPLFLTFMVFLIASAVSVASLLGDWGVWSNEDYVGALLLFFTPFFLIWIGIMDLVSATMMCIFFGIHPFAWRAWTWSWFSPQNMDFVKLPFLPWVVGMLQGRVNPIALDVLISTIVGLPVLFLLWFLYWKYT